MLRCVVYLKYAYDMIWYDMHMHNASYVWYHISSYSYHIWYMLVFVRPYHIRNAYHNIIIIIHIWYISFLRFPFHRSIGQVKWSKWKTLFLSQVHLYKNNYNITASFIFQYQWFSINKDKYSFYRKKGGSMDIYTIEK